MVAAGRWPSGGSAPVRNGHWRLALVWHRRRPPTIAAMRRLLVLGALSAFVAWRNRRLDEFDRAHGLGPYAKLAPVDDT